MISSLENNGDRTDPKTFGRIIDYCHSIGKSQDPRSRVRFRCEPVSKWLYQRCIRYKLHQTTSLDGTHKSIRHKKVNQPSGESYSLRLSSAIYPAVEAVNKFFFWNLIFTSVRFLKDHPFSRESSKSTNSWFPLLPNCRNYPAIYFYLWQRFYQSTTSLETHLFDVIPVALRYYFSQLQ